VKYPLTPQELRSAEAVVILGHVYRWLDDYYGPIEEYSSGNRGMVQLDHGHEEYEARVAIAAKVRGYFEADR
jgi:hypothetical protein